MKTIAIIALCIFLSTGNAQTKSPQAYFTAIIVSDIDRSVEWYQNLFDTEVLKRVEMPERGVRIAILKGDELLIELLQLSDASKSEGRAQGFFKIGFMVEDIDNWVARLKGNEVEFYGGLVYDESLNKRTQILKDPDGNYIQLFGE